MTNDLLNKLVASITKEKGWDGNRCNAAVVMKWQMDTLPVLMQIAQEGTDFISTISVWDGEDEEKIIQYAQEKELTINTILSKADKSIWGAENGN
jgi:oligoribonuclease NrnB/cAMP/cGMP phosphodiesterase (DHH superfamily)